MDRFLRLSVPLVLVLVVVLWLLYRTQMTATLTIMQVNERQSIQLASQTIDAIFGVLRDDALYLAEHSSLQEWLDIGDIWTRLHLTTDFFLLSGTVIFTIKSVSLMKMDRKWCISTGMTANR